MADIRTFASLDALSAAAAEEIVGIARSAIAERGRFSVALAGGNTPRRTYELLGSRFRDDIDWARVDVLFGDERMVPPDDPRSNYRMAREAFLTRVPVPAERVHRVPTELPTPAAAAEAYERTLRAVLEIPAGTDTAGTTPTVDLALLGVGPDGHTASLFPASPTLAEQERWTRGVDAPAHVQPAVARVTTTLPFLDAARTILFLVAGADKRAVVTQILEHGLGARDYPAAMIRSGGRVLWMVDRDVVPDRRVNA